MKHYIYDNVLAEQIYLGRESASSPTLVLQTDPYEPVHFALEFKNNTGTTLDCQQGEILPLCKFYVAGVLDPSEGSGAPSLHSVFHQDYYTSVKVGINNLKNAYNTVPDLHSPQLEIGLYVDMAWMQLTPKSIQLEF